MMLKNAMRRKEDAIIKGFRPRVFDWDQAIKIIEDKGNKDAKAGLHHDMEFTGGTIYCDGKRVYDSYTYLASKWATPIIVIDDEEIECWSYSDESPQWDQHSKWPEKTDNDKTTDQETDK